MYTKVRSPLFCTIGYIDEKINLSLKMKENEFLKFSWEKIFT